MAISFQSDEEVLRKLRDKLRKMTDEELIRFGKEVRRLAENPFQRRKAPMRSGVFLQSKDTPTALSFLVQSSSQSIHPMIHRQPR